MSSAPSPKNAAGGAQPLHRLLANAADAVQAVRDGHSLTDWLARCPADVRPGVQALSFTVLRRLGAAQAARALLAPKNPPPRVDALLVTALALLWPGETAYADHTLVDQAVHAVRQRAPNSAGFVNAVLRRFLRERDALVAAVEADPLARFNHPRWWQDRLRDDWPAQWEGLLRANQQRPPMTLRVNPAHDDVEGYLARLREAGIAAHPAGALFPQAVVLDEPRPVQALPGFDAGHASVQDASAQLAAPLLLGRRPPQDLAPGEAWPTLGAGARVLDACAAPGGKTAHLQELAGNGLDLLALDADAKRLERVRQNLSRLALDGAVRAADARDTAAWWDGRPFDAILLDAPCSASGIVRRHPDVRWLRRPDDIASLARTQAALLEALWPTLKPGGRLLYATCSVFKAEGQDQIDAFLQRHGDARSRQFDSGAGHLLPLADNASQDSAPGEAAVTDGFYYALLQKA
ncbi:16S rRNA (cytosine(967)-C(5))-methyltransferase RsmB [Mitsuaria sp. GD03876]|uniref:16S rRNA (cytosine(967)-C(5))-methyltransferase RsmB n=1 Tax=Mitsuaria sp. GD03876 TaxID=2975399 RepID=UPI00244B694C|nr:16S rRNA (cytosine(967)-C(5))-methyltransferase RsmB [Mitsuaria sp. GD03876]MDH0864086.1 16S rRNA (cytosine(967)-C(5))-methyltransferase RsmB [Mitsuaria sp. GD03876]